MANVSTKIVEIKEGIQVAVARGQVQVTGPKGTLTAKIPYGVKVEVEDTSAKIKKIEGLSDTDKFAGLMRAMLANMVKGVSEGFKKDLELSGVGYRARTEGQDLVLNVGFSNAVKITPPEGVEITVNENIISVTGVDKVLVGDLADKIRKIRIPDPYKAKGIKYVGEYIRRKVGKAAKAVGAATK